MLASPAPVSSIASLSQSPVFQPILLDLPKDVSFLELESSNNADAVSLLERMESSLEGAAERVSELEKRLTSNITNASLVHRACLSALSEEMARKLGQASLLLTDAKSTQDDNNQDFASTKSQILSVALMKSLQYLDTLESAVTFSSRDRLDTSLQAVLDALAGSSKVTKDVEENVNLYISSWLAPSLTFDFRVGQPARHSVGSASVVVDDDDSKALLPMDLEVKPIMEYFADELIQQSVQMPKAGVFTVSVIKCDHKKKKAITRDGFMGEALVQVHIAPLAEKKKKEAIWGQNEDVEKIRIKEVRA